MSLHDPISDLLTRIRNAIRAKHRYVDVDLSKMKVNIVKVLQETGFVDHHLIDEEKRKMRIILKYGSERAALMENLKRNSKLGVRHYIGYRDIPRIRGGMGITILSTPMGIMDGEKARSLKVGGELLCTVW